MRSDENYVKNTDGEDIGRYRFYNIVGTEEENEELISCIKTYLSR